MGQEAKQRRRWKLVLTLITFAALGILIYAVRDQIAQTISNLGKVDSWALWLMIPLQLINYDAYTRLYRHILAMLDESIAYWSMFRLQLELNFVNHILPSGGVSGFSYFSLRARSYGIPASKATLTQFMRFILIFISFQVLLLLGLLMLAIGGQANNLMILISGSLATLLVVLTVGMAYILGSKARINSFSTFITRLINRMVREVRRNKPDVIDVERVRHLFNDLHENYVILQRNYRQLKLPLLFSLLANLTEVLTLYVVYIAFGYWVNPGAIIIAYAIANFAGLISFLPAGVGVYEALMTATLAAAGIPAGLSIPVTVMYRVLSMAIQLPPGYYFYYRNLHKRPDHAAG
ncbi:MAG TPA: lysylphosphatidylglycerol synthase transmembrane domain-containing protein [Patescibacteria group bacterium]|nr:lysylphosphatidylglycerol synthase transmembrane domain-containing protein [Patescibacteria group bacterium]